MTLIVLILSYCLILESQSSSLCLCFLREHNISLVFKYLRMCLLVFAKPLETAGGKLEQYSSNLPLFDCFSSSSC